jgi:hypothetical protein
MRPQLAELALEVSAAVRGGEPCHTPTMPRTAWHEDIGFTSAGVRAPLTWQADGAKTV